LTQFRPGREVVVAGVGLHPFGRFPDKDLASLAVEAVVPALNDAGVGWRDIPVAYFGHVYYDGMSVGESALAKLGLTGIPIINVENACSSGSTAFWQAYWGITSGLFDLALAFGAEKVPRGPVTVTGEESPERYIGGDHMMAGYALRMRRYMEDTGATDAALAQVAVKARHNGALNPYAHRTQTYTLEQVLQSRLIADPLTLFQCCPTSEGAAAAVLCAGDSLHRYGINESRTVRVAAAVLRSGNYNGKGSDHSAFSPYRTEPAALEAYEMSGLGPEDIDLVQVHDAATIGELQQLEALQVGGPPPFALRRSLAGHAGGPDRSVRRHTHQHRRRHAGDGPSFRGHRHPDDSRERDSIAPGSRATTSKRRQSCFGPMLRRRRRNHSTHPC